MQVVKWLFIVMLGIIVGAVGIGFMLPDSVHVERSTTIDAPPATVFAVLNGFKRFQEWSPWAGLDPNAQTIYEGPPAGVGSRMSWNSADPNVGSGSQEILESTAPQKIRIKLVFGDFSSENYATYTLTPAGAGTKLVWGYDSSFHGNIIYRYFGAMMDGMLGPDYEKGLAKLKTVVEKLPKDDFSTLDVQLVQVTATPIATAHGDAVADQSGPVLMTLFGKVRAFVEGAGGHPVGAPFAITLKFDDQTHAWSFDAGYALEAPCTGTPEGEVQCGTGYGGAALRAVHKGPYAAMEKTYAQLMAYKTAAGFADNGSSWEHYVTDASSTPEAELVTHIYWPVK